MIVDVYFPTSITRVKYGRCEMQPDDDHKVEVPDYVAATLLKIESTVGDAPTKTIPQMIAASDFVEAHYLFAAFGKPTPAEDQVAAASALFAERGEPTASMS